MEEISTNGNRMTVNTTRTSDKSIKVSVELWSDSADTAYVTIDENNSETTALEDGHGSLELILPDERDSVDVHTVTAELFSGDEVKPVGALELTFTA